MTFGKFKHTKYFQIFPYKLDVWQVTIKIQVSCSKGWLVFCIRMLKNYLKIYLIDMAWGGKFVIQLKID